MLSAAPDLTILVYTLGFSGKKRRTVMATTATMGRHLDIDGNNLRDAVILACSLRHSIDGCSCLAQ